MHIIANIIYVFGLLFALAWGLVIRNKVKTQGAPERIFEVHGMLMVVSLIIIPVFSLSPFHLLWMFPVSFILGPLSMIPPFRLLWPFAALYGSIWYIGLGKK